MSLSQSLKPEFLVRVCAPLLLAALAACSTAQYTYRATDPTLTIQRGVPGVNYAISPPQGWVRIAPLGSRKVKGLGDQPVFVLRYYLENKSATDWTIDPAEQKVFLDGETVPRKPLASSLAPSKKPGTKKHFDAEAGRTQVFDLIYPDAGHEPSRVSLQWKIGGGTLKGGQVEFERVKVSEGSLEGGYVEQDVQVYLEPGIGVYRTVR